MQEKLNFVSVQILCRIPSYEIRHCGLLGAIYVDHKYKAGYVSIRPLQLMRLVQDIIQEKWSPFVEMVI